MRRRLLLTVFLFSAILSLHAQERTIKRKVAIGRFSNETQYAKGIFYNKENDPMRKQAADILASKLAASEKFILLERDDLELLLAENSPSLNKIGADYLILGSITEYGRKAVGEQRLFSSTKIQTVEAGVSLRLVDTSTGLIIYSDEAKGYAETSSKQTMGMGGTAGFDATLSDKAISTAMSQLVENIVNKCMDKPWRSYILSSENGTVIIAGGASQGLVPGDDFQVYVKGKSVRNPQTGMMIELPGEKMGTIRVTMTMGDTVENEISLCSYEGRDLDVNLLENYYVSEN